LTDIVRQVLTDLNVMALAADVQIVSEMNAYYERRSDHSQIREEIKTVYGQGIKQQTDPEANKTTEMYVKTGFTEQVDAGTVQAITVGFAPKVTNALATMFTEKGQKFTLVTDVEKDLKEAEKELFKQRKNGGFTRYLTDADKKSIRNGSCAVLVEYARDNLTYEVYTRDKIQPYYAQYVMEDGQPRAADTTKLEDASVIIIKNSQVDVGKWNYLAIFGRSDIYPDGRYVQFQSTDNTTEVPQPYTDGAIEAEIDGVMCNPLSKYANHNPDERIPEYPIAVIYGGTTDGDEAMPISTSLYEDSLTFDVECSHILGTSSDAARGTNVFKRTEEGTGKSLPRQVTANMALEAGIDFEHVSHDPQASKLGLENIKDLMVELASGYSVPDYMVTSEDHAIEAASGISLQVKTRPLKKERESRIELNSPSVNKIYQIESAFIFLFSDADDSVKKLLVEAEQLWDAGELKLPENKKEVAERIVILKKEGVFDEIAAIREWHQFSSDAEAIAMYEKMKARAKEFPPLNQPEEPAIPEKRPLGLLSRNNGPPKR